MIRFTKYFLLYVMLIVLAMTYHPFVMGLSHAAGLESGSVLSKYVLLLFGALSVVSFLSPAKKHTRLFSKYLIFLFLVLLTALFVYFFFGNELMLEDFRSLLIVIVAFFIGRSLRPNHSQVTIIMIVFSLAVVFSGLMQVIVNIGGFHIEDQYLAEGKNRLGAMLATASISILYLLRDRSGWYNDSKICKVSLVALFIIALAIILTIRARAALLTVVVLTCFWMYQKNRKRIISYLFVFIPVLLLILAIMPDFIIEYVSDSISAGSQGDDVSSGRASTYVMAIQRFLSSPLLCNVRNNMSDDIGWVHNYPLLKLYSFGLLFSWPLLGLYLYTLISVIKRSLGKYNPTLYYSGYPIMLVPFFISMLEPTFPFGPGTVTVYNFILLGVSDIYYTGSSLPGKLYIDEK